MSHQLAEVFDLFRPQLINYPNSLSKYKCKQTKTPKQGVVG